MVKTNDMRQLLDSRQFHFTRLVLTDIDNRPILEINKPEMTDEEICLFHRDVSSGDVYLERLHETIRQGMTRHQALPVVRFADGEYAFYNYDLSCNGLYRQAESVDAIKNAMPSHIAALKTLALSGKLAPLIFPGNINRKTRGLFTFFHRSKENSSASTFLEFIFHNEIELNAENYVPFYVVYAYLTSEDFIRLVDHKKICVMNSEFNRNSCNNWFGRLSSTPDISFVEIPAEYVATRWDSMKEGIIKQIPPDTELCLVGAGIGALPVCVDVAERLSIPAIDAGHVLNMMNDCVDKSNGSRLYTIRMTKNRADSSVY